METTRFGVQLKSDVSDGELSFHLSLADDGPHLNRFYVELWTTNGARIDGETFQKHVLAGELYRADPVSLSVEDAQEQEGRPTVRILIFENEPSGGNELFRHEHRFFGECGNWHYVSA